MTYYQRCLCILLDRRAKTKWSVVKALCITIPSSERQITFHDFIQLPKVFRYVVPSGALSVKLPLFNRSRTEMICSTENRHQLQTFVFTAPTLLRLPFCFELHLQSGNNSQLFVFWHLLDQRPQWRLKCQQWRNISELKVKQSNHLLKYPKCHSFRK